MADSYILRPVSDVSLTHTCSTGSSGYALIDDETHDSDSTYISYKYAFGSTSKSSTFLFTSKDKVFVNTTLPAGLMYGDVDMDGIITEEDSNLISNHAIGNKELTGDALTLADVNGDGNVNTSDALIVGQIAAQNQKPSNYRGDYLGNWTVSTDWGADFSGRFYYDVTTSDSTTSCMAILSPSFAVNKYEFYCQCFNGYVRVFAKNLPKYSINVTIEIFQSSEAISTTLPAGQMYGDINMDGVISQEDCDLLSDHLGGYEITDATSLILADLDEDGSVDLEDLVMTEVLEGQIRQITDYKGDYLGNWSLSTDWGADFSRRFYRDITTSASTTSTMAFVIPNGNVHSYSGFQCECFNGYIRVYAKNLPLNEISINIRVINLDKTITSTLPAGRMYGDFDDDGVLTAVDAEMFSKYKADNSFFDNEQIEITDINNDGSINGKDLLALRKIINLLTPDSTYSGDYLGNWSVNNTRTDGDPKVFYYDISNNQITTDYYAYIYTNSDASMNDYIAECFSGYVRIYAKNIPKAQTTIKIGLQQKKTYPLDAVSGVKIHMVAKQTGSLSNAQCNCYFAVGSESGGSSADMGVEVSSLTTSYVDYTSTSIAMAEAINNYIATNNAFPTISAKLTNSSSYSSYQIRVTQIYIELLYGEIGTNLRLKQNNSWTPVTKVFKKVNGSWVEQTNLSSLFNTNTKYIKG